MCHQTPTQASAALAACGGRSATRVGLVADHLYSNTFRQATGRNIRGQVMVYTKTLHGMATRLQEINQTVRRVFGGKYETEVEPIRQELRASRENLLAIVIRHAEDSDPCLLTIAAAVDVINEQISPPRLQREQ